LNVVLCTASDDGARWTEALRLALPEADIRVWPDVGDTIDYAVVWKPPSDLVARLGGARAAFNLGAGVDSLANLPWPPELPLIRLVDAGMAEQMAEYVTYGVLRRYREFEVFEDSQRASEWRPRARMDKSAFNIGILGLGVLGTAVANALVPLGFPVSGWSRTRKQLRGGRSFGEGELQAFLASCRVLVCLLPLTAETSGLLDRRTLSCLPRGAYLVNVARGALLVDDDLLSLIDAGHLAGAMLDVFRDEPLPPAHRFWHHPRITVTPHVSALTLIDASVAQIAAKIRRLEAGLPVAGVIDRRRGY